MALPSLSLLGKGRERENLAVSSNIRILFKGVTFVFFGGGSLKKIYFYFSSLVCFLEDLVGDLGDTSIQ